MVKYLKNFTGKAFREFYGQTEEPEADSGADSGSQDSTDSSWTEFSAQASDVVPVGTAEEVTDWVDGDADKASKALEAEEARSRPRKTLISSLEAIIDGGN